MSTDRSRSETTNASDIEWTPENEIKLFYALRGHKPVGVSKNFHMISILEEFSKLTERDVSSKTIWDRLEKLYDMDTLHENENLPFPPTSVPFTIEGIKEFDELIAKLKNGTESDKTLEPREEPEVSATPPTKPANKSKAQDSTKSNTKVKTENEKNSKSERKEDNAKPSDKSDDSEDKTNRSKKPVAKAGTELRSAAITASAKKRK